METPGEVLLCAILKRANIFAHDGRGGARDSKRRGLEGAFNEIGDSNGKIYGNYSGECGASVIPIPYGYPEKYFELTYKYDCSAAGFK
jgi:hypothetical protein